MTENFGPEMLNINFPNPSKREYANPCFLEKHTYVPLKLLTFHRYAFNKDSLGSQSFIPWAKPQFRRKQWIVVWGFSFVSFCILLSIVHVGITLESRVWPE